VKRSEIIAKARGILEDKGWAQGTFEDEDGQVCALGAIRLASHEENCIYADNVFSGFCTCLDSTSRWTYDEDLMRGIKQVTPRTRAFCVDMWNDAQRRTKDQVIWALKFAEEFALEREEQK
jgi:hypothetical protein